MCLCAALLFQRLLKINILFCVEFRRVSLFTWNYPCFSFLQFYRNGHSTNVLRLCSVAVIQTQKFYRNFVKNEFKVDLALLSILHW